MPKAMLKKVPYRINSKNYVKMPTDFTFSFDRRAFFFFTKIAKIAVTFTVEILLCG